MPMHYRDSNPLFLTLDVGIAFQPLSGGSMTARFLEMSINLIRVIPAKHFIILLLVAAVTLLFSNIFINGSLLKTDNLSGELKSPPDSLYQWNISNEPPFKYRVLHKAIVNSVYLSIKGDKESNELFFSTYRVFAFLFHAFAILIFYYFTTQIGLKELAFVGAILFACLPAMLFAYNVPVHTREDTLAYCILLLGLIAIIQNKVVGIFTLSLLGVMCRETLLILPFVNLFFNPKQKLWVRLGLSTLCLLVFAGIRFSLGIEPYNHWEGFNWNISHPEQVIAFTFVTFGVLWIPFLFHFWMKIIGEVKASILLKSALPVFALVFATTFLGGIFNEIRILYLLAPWVISIGLLFYSHNHHEITEILKSRKYIRYALVTLGGLVTLSFWIVGNYQNYINPSEYDIPYSTWIITCLIQFYLCLLALPYFYKKMIN
jgi:hypothetical protein